jgi:hypothetical protein
LPLRLWHDQMLVKDSTPRLRLDLLTPIDQLDGAEILLGA